MTFLGPIEKLKTWHQPTRAGYTSRGVVFRRETDGEPNEVAADVETRYAFHPFKPDPME